jgi:hypothetical protein
LGAAGVAEEGLVAEKEEGGDGFAFGQAGQEFLVGGAGHRMVSLLCFWRRGKHALAKEKNRKSLNT